MKRYPPLTDGQKKGLKLYQKEYPDTWPHMLAADWFVGGTGNGVLKPIYHHMQQLRNTHGPAWLNAYIEEHC